MTMEEASAAQPKEKNSGEFFAVERPTLERVINHGMNAAVAYLVLASGSFRLTGITKWSVNSIEKYTSISRKKAKAAVKLLCDEKYIEQTQSGSSPIYKILPFHEIGGDYFYFTKAKKKKTEPPEPDYIWMPNSLITGVGDEIPPIEKIRQTGDKNILALFTDFYHVHDLITDGGIPRTIIYGSYEREKIGEWEQFIVWGFAFNNPTYYQQNDVMSRQHQDRADMSKEEKQKGVDLVFSRLDTLEILGLIEWIPYLFESEDKDAEIRHPCDYDYYNAADKVEPTTIEQQIGAAAHIAGFNMLTIGQQQRAVDMLGDDVILCPVPKHMKDAAMIGIAKLKYRPKTTLTKAWYAELEKTGEKTILEFQQLTNKAIGNSEQRKAV